jgi:tetratricopeptide (TPR) repeat protein
MWFRAGVGHNERGTEQDQDLALGKFMQALAVDPSHDGALEGVGVHRLLPRTLDLPGALEALAQAVALNASRPTAQYNLGNALHESGRSGEAVGAFKEAARLQPALAQASANLGVALNQLGRTAEALRAWAGAIAAAPHHGDSHLMTGVALFARREEGDVEEAEKALRRCVEVAPANSEAWYHLGALLYSADPQDIQGATVAWRECSRLDPSNAQVQFWCCWAMCSWLPHPPALALPSAMRAATICSLFLLLLPSPVFPLSFSRFKLVFPLPSPLFFSPVFCLPSALFPQVAGILKQLDDHAAAVKAEQEQEAKAKAAQANEEL